MILVKTDGLTQIRRLKEKNFSKEQIERRLKFQLADEKCMLSIKEMQEKEHDRFFMEINGSDNINKNSQALYEKLQEEYQKRAKIIR